MNQIIQSLMDFLSPDAHITPNPIANTASLMIIALFFLGIFIKSFDKFIMIDTSNMSLKQKILPYCYFIGSFVLLVVLFFPAYNILRTALNPEVFKRLW